MSKKISQLTPEISINNDDLIPFARPGSSDTFRSTIAVLANKVNEKVRLSQGERLTFMYDDFDRSDRVLHGDTTPMGQVWSLSGAGQLTTQIISGKVVGVANYYASLDYGTTITRVAGTFSFGSAGGTTRTGQASALIADAAQIGLANMLHLNFGATAWTLSKRLGGGAYVPIATDSTLNLQTDGTVYSISMEIDVATNTVVVVAPNGKRTTVVDADVGVISPRYGIWQYTADGIGYEVIWRSVSLGPSIAEALRAEGLGAGMADLDLFFGSGMTLRERITGTLTGGVGWYRVSNRSIFSTFGIVGNIKISANSAIRNTFWDVDVNTYLTGGISNMVQKYAADYAGGTITQLRLSRDDVAFTSGLDIYSAFADAVTFSIEFNGAFTPIVAPVVGAADLGTASYILPIDVTNNARWRFDQSVNDAAIPVIELDQADISEGFINFVGSDRGAIAGATNSLASARVELGGIVYRLALYVDA